MIHPIRSLVLLGYIALMLTVVLFVLPTEWKISDQLAIRSFTIRSLFVKETVQYADISQIKQKFSNPTPVRPVSSAPPPRKSTKAPAAQPEKKVAAPEAPRAQPAADTLEARYQIQFPDNDITALQTLFKSLQKSKKGNPLFRVLHYGDSQIEGDRITAFLRKKFQEQFGGCGVGLVPIIDPLGNRTSIVQRGSASWKKVISYGPGYNKTAPRHYGVLGSYFAYSEPISPTTTAHAADTVLTTMDSLPARSSVPTENRGPAAFVGLYRSKIAFRRERQFETLRLLYRNPDAPFELTITTPGDTLVKHFDSHSEYRTYRYSFADEFTRLKLTFQGDKSPELYGMALDCNSGVAVDNIPFRGSSGTEFTRLDRALLQQQLWALNVKCVIMQFGVNVVPFETESYKFYEQQLYAQLRLFKSLAPDISILVVGVSDMSRKEGEFYVSYPNIEKIRNAQRNAAFKAGCAFFDLYEAMGGKNSMPSWVLAQPALAHKDFTHFTPKGAMLVSEMLYNALMTAYEKYNHPL